MTLYQRFRRKKRALHEQWRRFRRVLLIPLLQSRKFNENGENFIVSLTSYGKRLANTAPYAIITLLRQKVKPDKVILWVGHQDRENIPKILYCLTDKGLEIRFCEDVKSYTKLIPALEAFPDACIITADDDIFYPKNWFGQLLIEHRKNPKKIICHRVHGIITDENHNPLAYNEWDKCIEPNSAHKPESYFPTGVGGILYPPKCFHKDIANRELFLKLAPNADDIWFWAMALINGEYFDNETPYVIIEKGSFNKLRMIDWWQHVAHSLQSVNVSENRNDGQLKAIIDYYPQIGEKLKEIEPAKTKT
ncbi:MAG: glycosyltransferase family 2 protein [Bacteroidales bacterium]|jgi:hypothetical protein|nr:glycosyltransferase family 2 protein [Bacteroidales bacterium]